MSKQNNTREERMKKDSSQNKKGKSSKKKIDSATKAALFEAVMGTKNDKQCK